MDGPAFLLWIRPVLLIFSRRLPVSNKTDKNRITYPFNDFTALVVATR